MAWVGPEPETSIRGTPNSRRFLHLCYHTADRDLTENICDLLTGFLAMSITVKLLGLKYVLRFLFRKIHRDIFSSLPNGFTYDDYVLHDCVFGIPLFNSALNQAICSRMISKGILEADKLVVDIFIRISMYTCVLYRTGYVGRCKRNRAIA